MFKKLMFLCFSFLSLQSAAVQSPTDGVSAENFIAFAIHNCNYIFLKNNGCSTYQAQVFLNQEYLGLPEQLPEISMENLNTIRNEISLKSGFSLEEVKQKKLTIIHEKISGTKHFLTEELEAIIVKISKPESSLSHKVAFYNELITAIINEDITTLTKHKSTLDTQHVHAVDRLKNYLELKANVVNKS